MNSYKNCIVAFLDILGFKQMINKSAYEDILTIFRTIISPHDAQIAFSVACDPKDESYMRYNHALSKVQIHIMSDSIVIAAPSEYAESLAVVINICNAIQYQFYDLEKPVLLRGAIAQGDIYIKDGLCFGKALVDAYIAQENCAIYPRIIISNQIAENRIADVGDIVHLREDKTDHYLFIDTLENYIDCKSYSEWDKNMNQQRICSFIQSNLNDYLDPHVREKYLWMKKALHWVEADLALKEGILIVD